MSGRLLSSITLRELIGEIEQMGRGMHLEKRITLEKGLTCGDEKWAEAMTKKHYRALHDHPVVVLTEQENAQAREYLARYKEVGLDIPDRATSLIREKHAGEIRDFLKAKHNDQPESIVWAIPGVEWDIWDSPPFDAGDPTCFNEWFAGVQVWRLSLAMAETPFPDAAVGTRECRLGPLPKLWEDKLDECMRITNPSAIIPTPRGQGLPVTRADLNSVLPTWHASPYSSELITSTIIDRWFQILKAHQDQKKRGSTVIIYPDSLELAGAAPPVITAKILEVDPHIGMILFPTVIKERDHCVLAVALPKRHLSVLYDSLGPESTKKFQKTHPWMMEVLPKKETRMWEVKWKNCPRQHEADLSGIFMLINALLVGEEKEPEGMYSHEDALFLRRFIAAVICMGELPPLCVGKGMEERSP